MPLYFGFKLIVTVSNYFKQTNIQIMILTPLARRNVLACGTFGEVGVKQLVTKFSGPGLHVAR